MPYTTLFGPVPSRRIGVSLGVDLVPFKVCSFNCIYCEVGETTTLTTRLSQYVPAETVIAELGDYLRSAPRLDFITFSGSGEPLLNAGIGEVIAYLREHHPGYRIALLTNASLLSQEAVREEVLGVDLALPSLDAATEQAFQKINRPHPSLRVQGLIEGLRLFRQGSRAEMWLEVFILPGYNDGPEQLQALREALLAIDPDRVQLNTLDRPGTVADLQPAGLETLQRVSEAFAPLPTEIIAASSRNVEVESFRQDIPETILQTLRRRPCTDDDLCALLGLHKNELNKYIQTLAKENKITSERQARGLFWRCSDSSRSGG